MELLHLFWQMSQYYVLIFSIEVWWNLFLNGELCLCFDKHCHRICKALNGCGPNKKVPWISVVYRVKLNKTKHTRVFGKSSSDSSNTWFISCFIRNMSIVIQPLIPNNSLLNSSWWIFWKWLLAMMQCFWLKVTLNIEINKSIEQVRIRGRQGAPPLTLGFESPKLSIFGPNLIFPFFCLALLGILFLSYFAIFHSLNSKIVQPCFAHHIISQLIQTESLCFTRFRLLSVHLSLSCF